MLDEECIVPKASDQTLAQKLCEQHLGMSKGIILCGYATIPILAITLGKHANFEKPKPPKGKQGEGGDDGDSGDRDRYSLYFTLQHTLQCGTTPELSATIAAIGE